MLMHDCGMALIVAIRIIFATSLTDGMTSFPSTLKIGHIFCDVRQEQAAIAFSESMKKIKLDQVIPNSINIELSYVKGCDDVSSLNATMTLMSNSSKVDVIIGPEYTDGMQVSALLCSLENTPIIGYASFGDALSNKTKYSTLIRTSFAMGALGEAVGQLLKKFQWKNVALIRSNITECSIGLSGIYNVLRLPRVTLKAEIIAVTPSEIDKALDTVKNVARIIILCYGYEPSTANSFLKQAHNKSMTTTEYVYIIPYYLRTRIEDNSARPWESAIPTNDTSDRQLMQDIYQHVLVVQASGDDSSLLETFKITMEERAAAMNLSSIKLVGKEPLFLPMIHDSLYTYALALNHTIALGENYNDGRNIFNIVRRSIRFKGVTGFVTMDNSSDRYGDYDVYGMNKQNSFEKMFTVEAVFDNITGELSQFQAVMDGRLDPFPTLPKDTPECGFNQELCPTNHAAVVGIALGAASGLSVIIIIALFYYRKRKHEKDIFRMIWKLQLSDVKFMATRSSNLTSLRSVGMSSLKGTIESTDSHSTLDGIPDGDFKAMANVRGTPAFAKCWQRKRQGFISLDRHQLLTLKQMKTIQHDNVNPFLGAIFDDGPTIMIFWKHCAKGSLHDLVMNEDILLDQMFIISILNDVISGLDYLHNKSALHCHGNLSITNCLVDCRWTVKLTDFGWVQIHEELADQGHLPQKMVNAHRLYHCAPEILRCGNSDKSSSLETEPVSMQAADIYALSIVLYHILFRTEPYSDDTTEPEVILGKIQERRQHYTRPVIPKHNGSIPNLIGLMQKCWAEDPARRPTVTEIKRLMYSYYGKSLKRSLMDHVMSLLEKYATNLERIVEERTQQVELERKRADQLLYQMLPRSVADMLKSGQAVEPESYECVTVYFSDIVGFTALSSSSTPIQVVAMLNSLYSAFDESIRVHDVYKVETIGDAYMVVSGLPKRNGNRHVFEICEMALSNLEVVSNFEIAHKPGERLRIRIGIHSGSVAAGIVGLTMPRYCLFGDTVNTASRMESNGMPLKIHISEQTRNLLLPCADYIVELRGEVELKGKGVCVTYWLLEKRKGGGLYQGLYKVTDKRD